MRIDPKIKEDLKQKLKADIAQNKKRVVVVSAYKLFEAEMNNLYNFFPQLKQSQIEFMVDNSLLAGYLIKIGSNVTDLSLKGQLQNLKNLVYEIA